mmetsp:Transcript_1544/g.2756  ORF Transcript_1544/g.2756 Transcript_1544/m.2756 type:complete len:851 (-) Transcript_1544:322-2874(-)
MNPFDQFAGTIQAALPPSENANVVPPGGAPQQPQQPTGGGQQQQFSLMAQPAQEKKPVMNAPGMPAGAMVQHGGGMGGGMYGQQPQQGGMGGGMYGAPPPQQGMYGQPPPQQQQQLMMAPTTSMTTGFGMNNSANGPASGPGGQMGGGMIGMAPPMQQLTNGGAPTPAMSGALVPSHNQSNPYALGPAATANPFGAPAQLGAPAPQLQLQNANPFGAPASVGQYGGAPASGGQYGGAPALGAPAPGGQVGAPAPLPLGAPAQAPSQRQLGAPQSTGQMVAMDPFSAPAPPLANGGQMVAMDPFSAPAPGALGAPAARGAPGQPPVPAQLAADPWGAPAPPSAAPPSNAMVPSSAPAGNDPFGVFGGGPLPATQPASLPPSTSQRGQFDMPSSGASVGGQSALGAPPSVHPGGVFPGAAAPPPAAPQPAADDPWNDMFGAPAPSAAPTPGPAPSGPVPGEDDDLFGTTLQPTREEDKSARGSQIKQEPEKQKRTKEPTKRKKGELPAGGEWYDAKIFTPTLGVMFFKPKELVDSLFLQTDKKLVEGLEERPVVAFIVEGSSARSAGVELGHVLLKVNGIDVKNPKEASRLIKEGPRPLPLLFYVPETTVVVAEGEHMVKYNTKETGAPNSAKDWKPKYVVIGGIIAQPWMMNMYRSKSEYDIAVIETQARRPVSVKVKQFSLQGARIQNDWQGPQMVKYKNKLHPWKYIVILPISRNPMKIASPSLNQLKPVHEGIRRVLMAQQRDRGSGGQRASQGRDPHRRAAGGQGSGHGGGGEQRGGPANSGAYYGGRGASGTGQGQGGGYDTRGNYHGAPPNGDHHEGGPSRKPSSPGAFYGGRTAEDKMGMGSGY